MESRASALRQPSVPYLFFFFSFGDQKNDPKNIGENNKPIGIGDYNLYLFIGDYNL